MVIATSSCVVACLVRGYNTVLCLELYPDATPRALNPLSFVAGCTGMAAPLVGHKLLLMLDVAR